MLTFKIVSYTRFYYLSRDTLEKCKIVQYVPQMIMYSNTNKGCGG